LREALGVPAYRASGTWSAPDHPRSGITLSPTEFSRPAGIAPAPADQAAAATIDWVPRGAPTDTPDGPETAVSVSGPARPGTGALPSAAAAGSGEGIRAGDGHRAQATLPPQRGAAGRGVKPSWIRRHRLAAVALVGAVVAAAVVVPLALARPPSLPKAASSPKVTRSAKATSSPRARTSPTQVSYNRVVTIPLPSGGVITSVAFSPSGATLAVGDHNGSTYLWNTATKRQTAAFTDPGSQGVDSVAFSPSGTTVATADVNGNTYLWDIATQSTTAALADPNSMSVTSVAFSPSGTTLATGDLNGNTYLWDVTTGRLIATFTTPGGAGVVTSVAFSPGGTKLAVGDGDEAYLWDVAARTLTATFTVPNTVESVVQPQRGDPGRRRHRCQHLPVGCRHPEHDRHPDQPGWRDGLLGRVQPRRNDPGHLR